jgi:hypothetical protein
VNCEAAPRRHSARAFTNFSYEFCDCKAASRRRPALLHALRFTSAAGSTECNMEEAGKAMFSYVSATILIPENPRAGCKTHSLVLFLAASTRYGDKVTRG